MSKGTGQKKAIKKKPMDKPKKVKTKVITSI
jgi:hypothetical protein